MIYLLIMVCMLQFFQFILNLLQCRHGLPVKLFGLVDLPPQVVTLPEVRLNCRVSCEGVDMTTMNLFPMFFWFRFILIDADLIFDNIGRTFGQKFFVS